MEAPRQGPGPWPGGRVVVCESDPLEAAVILSILAQGGHIGVAVSSPQAVLDEITIRESTGVVLAEGSSCPDVRQVCSDLRANEYQGAIVELLPSPDPAREANLLRGGADAVLSKPVHPHLLLARLEAASRRRVEGDPVGADVLKVGDAELSVRDLRLTIAGRRPIYLTVTEARLLEHLMHNSPRTVTRDRLIERAWPDDEIVDPNRIEVYMARLRKKIEPSPARPTYIHTARGVGYYFRPSERPPLAGGHGTQG